jgi:hemerythrin HHE cation binding domain-containing protein
VPGVLYRYLSDDHDRLDALLERAVAKPGMIDMESYSEFRKGLLRHISMEEKIVLPAIAKWQGGKKAAIAERLRLDHSAIVSLLVPLPTPSIVLTLRAIFAVHNPREEQKGGLYELFEKLAGPETETMLSKLKAAPAVLVLPHNEKPDAMEVTKRAVARAGYEFMEKR